MRKKDKDKDEDMDKIMNVALCAAVVVIQVVAYFRPESIVAVMLILLAPILIIELL